MDADEIARLREEAEADKGIGEPMAITVLALLDALEQAQNARDAWNDEATKLAAQRDQAQKEAWGRDRQLNDLLHFQNSLVEAAEMPADLTPKQVLPWFVERLCSADAGDYESAMGPARAEAMRGVISERDQALKDAKDARALAYEECAKMADDFPGFPGEHSDGSEIAAAIRARIEAMLEQKL